MFCFYSFFFIFVTLLILYPFSRYDCPCADKSDIPSLGIDVLRLTPAGCNCYTYNSVPISEGLGSFLFTFKMSLPLLFLLGGVITFLVFKKLSKNTDERLKSKKVIKKKQ